MFAKNYITTGRGVGWQRHGRSLFQITRCAQNRLPREQPAPAPDSEPTAIALRSPYCLANVPRTPQRTPRPHPLAQTRPTRAPTPRKKRHSPASPVPSAAPSNPAHVPPLHPRLRHFSPPIRPQSRNFASPLVSMTAHTCYPRPREGPTPRPGNPTPKRGKAPGIRRGVENWAHLWHRRTPCPPLSRGATLVSQNTRSGSTDSHRSAGSPSYEAHRMEQNGTDFAFSLSREQRCRGCQVI